MSTQRWETAPPELSARVVTKLLRTDDTPMTDSLSTLRRRLASCGHSPTAGPDLPWTWKILLPVPMFSGLPV
jgi:hypothetical protein